MDAKKETLSQIIRDRGNCQKEFSKKEIGIRNEILMQLRNNIFSDDKLNYKVLQNGEVKKEIERLEIENIYLKQIVADLRIENNKLKKG